MLWYCQRKKKSSKKRRICNAKAAQNGASLKDNLLAGPDLLGNTFGIFLRFVQGAFVNRGDIKAMHMQIGVQQQDRRYLRYLWRQSKSPEIDMYKYQGHNFGAMDSPACAKFVLQQRAKDDIENHSGSLEIKQQTFCMDASFSDAITAFTTAKDVLDTLKKRITLNNTT